MPDKKLSEIIRRGVPGTEMIGSNLPGYLSAADSKSGRTLWRFNTGQPISASPMAYAVAGTQYVSIAAASDVFVFALMNEKKTRKDRD